MEKENPIIVIGSINMDLVNHVKTFPLPGETVHGKHTLFNSGGKGANQAVAASRLGGKVTFLGAVGEDPFANSLLASLRESKVNTDQMVVKEGHSGLAFITVDDKGENEIILSSGANGHYSINDLFESDFETLLDGDNVTLLLQNEIPWETTYCAMRRTKQLGARVIFNPAPAFIVPDETYPFIDILVLNETEISILTGNTVTNLEEIRQVTTHLLEKGTKSILLTLGEKGSFYKDKNEEYIIPAFKVKEIDTTAAGDTFIGAFAVADHSLDRKSAIKYASAAAALSVTRNGAQSSIPEYQEVKQFIYDSEGGKD